MLGAPDVLTGGNVAARAEEIGASGLRVLRLGSVDRRVDAIMSNSFGFGGTNASLIFRRLAE